MEKKISGYNEVASFYDNWEWQELWREVEQPLVFEATRGWNNGNLLSIGVGTGLYIDYFLNYKNSVLGVDPSQKMLNVCSRKFKADIASEKLKLINCRFEDMPENQNFNWGVITRVLHHVEDLSVFFEKLSRLMKLGAKTVITDIHPKYKFKSINVKGGKTSFEIGVNHYSYGELMSIIKKSGFRVCYEKIVSLRDIKRLTSQLINNSLGLKQNSSQLLYLLVLERI